MRVQQRQQSLRLRIDEAELARLLAGEAVENAMRWPDGRVEVQRVALTEAAGWLRTDDGWRVQLPQAEVRALAARLPSRDGLAFALDGLDVAFDVDVRDSARRLKEGRA